MSAIHRRCCFHSFKRCSPLSFIFCSFPPLSARRSHPFFFSIAHCSRSPLVPRFWPKTYRLKKKKSHHYYDFNFPLHVCPRRGNTPSSGFAFLCDVTLCAVLCFAVRSVEKPEPDPHDAAGLEVRIKRLGDAVRNIKACLMLQIRKTHFQTVCVFVLSCTPS